MKKNNYENSYDFIVITKFWLDSKRDIKIQSYQKYEHVIDYYIKDIIGSIPIVQLKKENIINYFEKLNNDKVSISIQKTIFYIVNSSLKYAYKRNYCDYIDLTDIKFKNSNRTIYVFSKNQQLIIENNLKRSILDYRGWKL